MKIVEVRAMDDPWWPAGRYDYMCQFLLDHKDEPKACSFKFTMPFDREQFTKDAAVQIGIAFSGETDRLIEAEFIRDCMPEVLEAIDKFLKEVQG
jgi:hypothetical protein